MLFLDPHVPPKLLYRHGRGTGRLPDTKARPRTISLSSEAARVLAAIPRVDDNPIVIPGWIKGKAMRNLNDPWEIVCELQWNRSAARGALTLPMLTIWSQDSGPLPSNDTVSSWQRSPRRRARIQALLDGRYGTGRHPHRRGNTRPGGRGKSASAMDRVVESGSRRSE